MKDKDHMFISKNTERALDKIHLFMIKMSNKLGIEEHISA